MIRNRENQFELVRHKTESLQKSLEEQINCLKAEKANYKTLKVHSESLSLQDQSNQKLLATLKTRINELELELHQSESKQNEIVAFRNELALTNTQLDSKDDEMNFLRDQVKMLNAKLNDADRLKEIESVIKSQHWEEFGAIAENMKNLTKSIGKRTLPVIGFDTLINSNSLTLNNNNEYHTEERVFETQISESSAPDNVSFAF